MLLRIVLASWLLLLLQGVVQGQVYPTQQYTEVDGLPSSAIYDVTQTKDGRLCVGTRAGIALYDGFTFETQVLLPEAKARRFSVLRDTAGEVYAFAASGEHQGFHFDGQTWNRLPSSPPLIGKINLSACRSGPGGPEFLLSSVGGAIWLGNPTEWNALESSPLTGLPLAFVATPKGFYIADRTAVFRVVGTQLERIPGPYPDEICTLTVDPSNQQVIVVGGHFSGRLVDDQLVVERTDLRFDHRDAYPEWRAGMDEYGRLFVGSTDGTVLIRKGSPPRTLGIENGFADDFGHCFFLDRENLMWIGGMRGLTKFPGFGLSAYNRKVGGLSEDEVSALIQVNEQLMVLGHTSSLTLLDPKRTKVNFPINDPSQRTLAMAQTHDGRVWIAASSSGLWTFDITTQTFEHIATPVTSDTTTDFVMVDSSDRLIALLHGSIWRLEANRWSQLTLPRRMIGAYLRQVTELRDGRLLVASDGRGVGLLQDGESITYLSRQIPEANEVYCTTELNNGELWAGTSLGVMRLVEPDRMEPVDFAGQTLTRPIFFLREGHDGVVWIGTDNGVARWDGQNLRVTSIFEGMLGAETNRGAVHEDQEGHFWVGTNLGVNVFNPSEMRLAGAPPSVAFVGTSVGGQVVDLKQKRSFEEQREGVAIDFRTISFANESRVRHRYYLEGFENDWSDWDILPTRTLRYANLPAGRYRLHMQAMDIDARLSPPIATPWFTVLPPLWRRAWFLIGSVVLLAALGAGIYSTVHQRRIAIVLERKVADRTAALHAEKQRLEATLTSIADGVVAIAPDGEIVLWNDAAARITGWTSEQALGQRLDQLFGVDALQAILGPVDAPSVSLEIQVVSGRRRTVECTHAQLPLQALDAAYVIAFRDITQRLAAERNLARTQHLEALGSLAGGLAHDFNNLLTVVLGNLTLLKEQGDFQARNPQLNSIGTAIEQARTLTRQLLTFSKGGEPVKLPTAINPIVRQAVELALVGSTIETQFELTEGLPPVPMDAGQIAQVLHNLVLNARQAMEADGRLTLRSRWMMAANHGFVSVEVEDTGCGLHPEMSDRIFEPYFSTKVGGTGLGLSTAHSIVNRHGGSLTVRSQFGQGTTFSMVLPVALTAQSDAAKSTLNALRLDGAPLDAPLETARHPVPSILVMDDEAPVRMVLQSIIEQLGYICVTTADGQAALQEFQSASDRGEPYSCVILDLTVPKGMGGQLTMKRLLELDPDTIGVAMSGYAHEPIMARPAEYGFCLSLPKPYGIEEVRQILRQALGEAWRGNERD